MQQFLVRFGGLAILLGLLVWWRAGSEEEPKPTPAAAVAAPEAVISPARQEFLAEERTRAEREGRAQDAVAAQVIADKAVELAKRAKADERGKVERPAAAQRISRQYDAFIRTNTPTYLALVERAKALKGKLGAEVRCTICSGDHYVPYCVLCRDLKGKCRNCEGTGRILATEYCPWCVGSGRCFQCQGVGKMLCPFCDDGVIDPTRPPPPNELKVE